VETLTEISFIRWDREGHHPVREEVRRSAARAVDEIAAYQIACRKGGAAPPALSVSERAKTPGQNKERGTGWRMARIRFTATWRTRGKRTQTRLPEGEEG